MSLIKQALINRQALMEALSAMHPGQLAASHPELAARLGEGALGAGVGGGVGYATGDDGGMFGQDTHLRNALIGAGAGAGTALGGSAISRLLQNRGIEKGLDEATAHGSQLVGKGPGHAQDLGDYMEAPLNAAAHEKDMINQSMFGAQLGKRAPHAYEDMMGALSDKYHAMRGGSKSPLSDTEFLAD